MKKWLSGGLVLLVITASLAACSSNKTDGGGDKGAATSTKESIAPSSGPDITQQKLTLSITSRAGMTADSFNSNYGKYLEKKFPNWTFSFIDQKSSKLATSDLVAAGTPIDLMFESQFSLIDGVIQPGLAYDITSLLKRDNVDLNRFQPVTIDAMKAMGDGQIYGLPNSMQVLVLFYNKDIFDKFGVAYPKDGMTWDEAFSIGNKLSRTENGVPYYGLVNSTGHVLKLNPFSLPYADVKTKKSTMSDPSWKTIINTVIMNEAQEPGMVDYIISHKNVPGRDQFTKDRTIGMYVFFTDTALEPGMDTFNWDMVSVPKYKEKPNVGAQTYPDYLVVSKTSKNIDADMKVLEYITSDEFQTTLTRAGTVSPLNSPAVQKALGADFPKKVNWGAAFAQRFAETPAKGVFESRAESDFTNLVPQLLTGQMDLNTAMSQAQEAANKDIASMSN